MVDEIRTFDTRDFVFVDDNICGKAEYAKELFRAITPLKKIWGGQTSINFARDDELLDLYAKSGGTYAFIGFESISEENLRQMNKKWNDPKGYGHVIKKIHKAGINILGSFIFGLDDDDPTVFQRTLDFIMEHKVDTAQFNILTPLPGTRLHDDMDEKGQIISKDWAKYHACEVVFQPAKMSVKELEEGFYRLWHEMYSIPNILRRTFRSFRGIPNRIALNYAYRKKGLRMPRV